MFVSGGFITVRQVTNALGGWDELLLAHTRGGFAGQPPNHHRQPLMATPPLVGEACPWWAQLVSCCALAAPLWATLLQATAEVACEFTTPKPPSCTR